MNNVHYINDEIAIIGWSCRVPGANSISELWSLLLEGRCAVTRVPEDRFSLQKFGHPRRQERGRSYTWAAGVLDDIWGFDPSLFGISPREAVQMDPQQRILLQLTWEALEDAGIRPSSIAGTNVGVYVGASQIEYAHSFLTDQAIADSHFATGTSLAILANRISYIYDLQGPSVTVDTACSSSLVALHQAMEALRSGRVDTAIIAGINVISSPTSFIAFSQASMLSATGLCQAFSANADGFVRAEGGAVIVLRRATLAQANKNPIHGMVLATDVNSDGRTGGISLPSGDAQEALLKRVYARAGINPDRLAFVEAHGTGTPAGDPIEATALGRGLALGRSRANVLPIGSIKTNIGHLEPASGIVGVLKSLLALNHGILPPSLHCSERNPNIDFDGLNLTVCDRSLLLPNSAQQLAGVNSFGFGGTNAHAVVGPGRKAQDMPARADVAAPGLFAFSGETSAAVAELARIYADRLGAMSDEAMAKLAGAIIHRREHLGNRVVISTAHSRDAVRALDAFVAGRDDPRLISGPAVGDEMPVAFVYSGNGSQWVGMGIAAYRNNATFRTHFELVDSYFKQLAGWSLREAMLSETLTDRLPLTSVAQPLIFAIQSSATAALVARGLRPAAVLGHSVGEVAAAEAAGILSLRSAVEVIHYRSTHQELTRGKGRMMAVRASLDTVKDIVQHADGVAIAAYNSPRAATLAGRADALAALAAENPAIPMIDLDLDYPFHTEMMTSIATGLTADLKDLVTRDADVPFVSTVTGECIPGTRIDGNYWWRNVREPVQFVKALRSAAALGARYFVEIGPRTTLLKHISDSLDGEISGFSILPLFERNEDDIDPFDKAIAKALVGGAQLDFTAIFGADPGPAIALPCYPWQQNEYRFQSTSEAVGAGIDRLPFAGARVHADGLIWLANIDTAVHPDLEDHRVGDQVLFPGTGFLEIALSVARQWLKTNHVTIANFEILKALDLTNGETREMMTRVSPGSNGIEIFSRPRLSQAGWLLHCRGKMMHGNPPNTAHAPAVSGSGRVIGGDALYRLAAATGLHYGPMFRLVTDLTVRGDIVDVALAPATTKNDFLLDPIRLDCCSHGMFAAFPDVRAEERGVTYIPVRMDQVSLYRPHAVPQRARVEVLTKNSRAIVLNYYIFDAADEIVAILRGVRCQAIQTRRAGALESIAVLELPRLIDGRILGDTGVQAVAEDVIEAARSLGLAVDEAAPLNDAAMATEGWATAAAFEIARALGDNKVVDVDLLVTSSRILPEWQPWLVSLLTHLENAGLAKGRRGVWTLVDEDLPSSDSVINMLAVEHPSCGAELLLAGALTGFAGRVGSTRAMAEPPDAILPAGLLDFYDTANQFSEGGSATLVRVVRQVAQLYPAGRMLRVLQLGFGPLANTLMATPFGRALQLSVMESDPRRYEQAEIALSKYPEALLLKPDALEEPASYDLILSAGGLHRVGDESRLAYLRSLLAPRGMLLAVEPRPSLFLDMALGLQPNWFTLAPGGGEAVGPLRSAAQWRAALGRAGFGNVQAQSLGGDAVTASLVVGEAVPARPLEAAAASGVEVLIVTPAGTRPSGIATALAAALESAGVAASTRAGLDRFPDALPGVVVLCEDVAGEPTDSVAALTQRCMALKDCTDKLGTAKTKLWIVFSGALEVGAAAVRPVETGAWAFSRTLANELPHLDVRRLDVAPGVAAAAAAAHLAAIIRSDTAETELHTDGVSLRAVRVGPLAPALKRAAPADAPAALLQRRQSSSQRLSWEPVERKRPAANEVEIAVAATGLNFRDLMWTLSMLPDDMLEDGFTGPGLGLECSGRVVRVGKSVTGLAVGDRVVALAASAFSTHAVAPAGQVAKLPDSMTLEGAATIPVAFLTAYYSLIKLARLRRGERVLIHGGAGAVGMAAIQIARWRGAHVIATAGSVAKRDLLASLGVRHVLDSRSTSFAEEVRAITSTGVDVVLNSLAGEAMELSISCLKPFGRFVELGKRDYVSNTHVGLRPFRRNLSYFGVDLDQLVVGQKSVGEQLYREVMRLFERGVFTALPHSVFPSADVTEAFHLMQQSSHIGKIVVVPPAANTIRAANQPWSVSADGTHVITGAFGGFGIEAAKWLVDRGARYLVLVGRRGAESKGAAALLKDFAARGVSVIADPCDVSDQRSLQRLFEKVRHDMPPIVGVMHAAMVLDDAIVANLTPERFEQVLMPKVRGAENLDLLTRGLPLDYFVLFSSVTTLMGNLGQGNYVAANAFMEGLARRRRQSGLPALAVGWGPITDVGVVANSERLRENLQKLTGVKGMRAREALDLMAQALEQPAKTPALAVMTISPNDGGFAVDRLPVLKSPTYASFVTGRNASEGEAGGIDLALMLEKDGLEPTRRKVNDTIVVQLARVLHGRAEDISRIRPLGEIGLDSLMALELVMNLEQSFRLNLSLANSVGAFTVPELAEEIIAQVNVGHDRDDAVISTIAERHLEKVDPSQVQALKTMLKADPAKVAGKAP